MPRKGRAGRIEVVRDGVSEIVYVSPPAMGAGVSREGVAAVASVPSPFAARPAVKRDLADVLD
jgi:phage FluMu protein gp41